MTAHDPFADLARHYDAIMATVDYDRWLLVATALTQLLPAKNFRHLDLACGTGHLAKRLRQHGWNTFGADLSPAMLATATRGDHAPPAAAADMRALPFHNAFEYITCLFDSLNFILDTDGVRAATQQAAGALTDGGIFYCDIITARMVTEFFEDQSWTESNGAFSTTWSSTFDRKTGLAETTIRVNSGPPNFVSERIYPLHVVTAALQAAGLHLLGVYDAETWKAPGRKTVRIDIIAVKANPKPVHQKLAKIEDQIRAWLR